MNIFETSDSRFLGWRSIDWRELLRGAVQPLWRTRRALQSAIHDRLQKTNAEVESEVERAGEIEGRATRIGATATWTADAYTAIVRELGDEGRYRRAFDLFAAKLEGDRREADEVARELTATVHDACSAFVARIEGVERGSNEVESKIAKSAAIGPGVASERQVLSSRCAEIGTRVAALRNRAAAHRKQFEAWA